MTEKPVPIPNIVMRAAFYNSCYPIWLKNKDHISEDKMRILFGDYIDSFKLGENAEQYLKRIGKL